MKKLIVLAVFSAVLMAGVHADAAVAQGAYTCEITLVGPFFDRTAAYVTAPEFPSGMWLVLSKDMEKSLLATALTARSLSAKVWCYILNDSVSVSGTPMQTVGAICILAEE